MKKCNLSSIKPCWQNRIFIINIRRGGCDSRKEESMQELKFNNRKKLHRFLQTLPEGMVFFSNNEFRIHMPNGYISVGDDYHDYHCHGGSTSCWGYKRISDNIRDVKELIDKYGKGE